MVIKFLHIKRTVDIECTIDSDGIAQRCSIFEFGTSHPLIHGIVGSVSIEPVEDGQQIEWQLV